VPGEARFEQVGGGLAPVEPGWFVVNARDAAWVRHETFGLRCSFELSGPVARSREGQEPVHFDQLGVGLSVLQPGQPSTLYHLEPGNQEDFLVLSGRCVATIEGEQRELGPWDFVHCPPGTAHSFTATGDEQCVLLTVGARNERAWRYLATPLAESVGTETDSGVDADAPYGHWQAGGSSPL
jgi:quercetin dioxygenase-like cupin family protein